MTKINDEEYEVLKSLRDSWKWIARDNDTILWVYEKEPRKHGYRWDDLSGVHGYYWDEPSGVCESVDSDSFQFIQWGDENPFSIAELIEEYEKGYKGSWEHAIEFSEELFGESKEAEVKKDIDWAIKEIEGLETEPSQNYPHDEVIEKEIVLGILSQLDELGVLSPDWIGDNVEYAYYMTPKGTYSSAKAVIDPNKLENLLVPKQEKVTVDKEDAENIVDYKEMGWTLSHLIDDYGEDARHDELLAKAWLAYPNIEVEEEQKYYALIKGHELLEGKADWIVPTYWCLDTTNDNMFISDRITVLDKYLIKASKSEWNELGINNSNADFLKVEELEEDGKN